MKMKLIWAICIQCALGCGDDQKMCKDGKCVYHYCPEDFCDNLPGCTIHKTCSDEETFCSSDGSCVGRNKLCPCPSIKPNHCTTEKQTDDRCYSNSERCNGVEECPNGSDEKGCPCKGGLHSPSIYRSKRLFFAAVGFLLVAIVGVLFLRFQSQRSKRRKEAVPTVSLQISQMDNTMGAELSDDPPPPYPCNTPVDLQTDQTEISNKENVSVSVEENAFDVKEKSPPPPYSDVLAGLYIQIFPGICDGNDNR